MKVNIQARTKWTILVKLAKNQILQPMRVTPIEAGVVVLHLLVAEDPGGLRGTSSSGGVNRDKDLQERRVEDTITTIVIIGEVRREETHHGGVRRKEIHYHMINREAIAKMIAARKMFQMRRRELLVAIWLVITKITQMVIHR